MVWLQVCGGTGQQVGLSKPGERKQGEARTWAWKTGPAPAACRAAVSVLSELEGLKSHVSLQEEGMETQTHPGLPHRHSSSQAQSHTTDGVTKVLDELEFTEECEELSAWEGHGRWPRLPK